MRRTGCLQQWKRRRMRAVTAFRRCASSLFTEFPDKGTMFGKRTVMLLLGAFAFAVHSPTGLAQRFPSKPLTLVVGFAAGGGVDINARLLGSWLAEQLGQPV